jgi:hypothetical protein
MKRTKTHADAPPVVVDPPMEADEQPEIDEPTQGGLDDAPRRDRNFDIIESVRAAHGMESAAAPASKPILIEAPDDEDDFLAAADPFGANPLGAGGAPIDNGSTMGIDKPTKIDVSAYTRGANEEDTKRPLIPPGMYAGKLAGFRFAPSKAGNDMVTFKFVVTQPGPHKNLLMDLYCPVVDGQLGRRYFETMRPLLGWTPVQKLTAEQMKEFGDLDEEKLVGRPVTLIVYNEPYNDEMTHKLRAVKLPSPEAIRFAESGGVV